MIECSLLVRALRARHAGNPRAALAVSQLPAVLWMYLDRHHIAADTIPADVVATVASESGIPAAELATYFQLAPCTMAGRAQPMTPLSWAEALASLR